MLENCGYLPQHHLKDKRLNNRDHDYYLCSYCGHVVDTKRAVRMIDKEEIRKMRDKVLKYDFKRTK